MSTVSVYPHIKESEKCEIMEISDVMDFIKSDHWRQKIEYLRVRVKEGAAKSEREKIKEKFPNFTVSGVFKKRNLESLIQHSGKMAIDFDDVEEYTTLEDARRKLNSDKYSEYVFLSCSGTGFCVIVNVEPEKHLETFIFLEEYYAKCHGLKVDKGCKDITRTRYISFDPDLYYNEHYETVELKPAFTSIEMEGDAEKFEWAKKIVEKKEKFEVGNRHRFMVVLAFFLNKCGVDQQYTLDRYLKDYLEDGKDEKEVQRIVRDCYKNTTEHGTFVINKKSEDMPPEFREATKHVYAAAHVMNRAGRKWEEDNIHSICKQHLLSPDVVRGIFKHVFEKFKDEFDFDDKPEIYKIEHHIKKKWEVVKNEVSQRYEYRPQGSDQPFEKLNPDTIFRDLQYSHYKFSLDKLKSLLRSDYIPMYNPFKIYFDNLPSYSDKEEIDYIDQLADFVQTDNQDFWRAQFKKALVRSIPCAVEGKENRIIITLVEPNQETGKTSFIRFLCPPFLKDYYTEASMDGGKDSDMQLSENFMWNLEELSALNNVEVNKLKAIISKSIVKQRRAYAEFHDTNPRRVTFWASTNKSEFLTDDQNTRWLCFNVESIDHDYNNYKTGVKKVDINNVWAQAYHLYKSGFNYHLTKEEIEIRNATNKTYELSSAEKDLLLEYFRPVAANSQGAVFYTPTDILLSLQDRTDNKVKLNSFAIGKALRQLDFVPGWKRIDNKSQRGWWLKEVDVLNAPVYTYSNTPAATGQKEKEIKKKLF